MLKIRQLRTLKNESQSDLAEKIGVSLRTVQNYESGNVDVPTKKLELIAKHYGVSISDLFSVDKDIVFKNEEKKEFKYNEIIIPDDEIISYLIENENRLLSSNKTISLWLKTKVQEGVIKVLGKS